MATLSSNYVTLADAVRRVDGDGKMASIIELLSQLNEILDDIPSMPANMGFAHKSTVRTGLPSGTWRLLYQGVAPTRSTTAQVITNCAMLEAFPQIDKALADLWGNTAEFRLSELHPHLEGLSQQMASALIYSNAIATPNQLMGLAPIFNSPNTANAQTAANVIDCGGTASVNTSVWVVVWSDRTVHAIHPKGSKAGLQHTDLGDLVPARDSNNNEFRAYREHLQWHSGLVVADWRYVVRLCNIDVNNLIAGNGVNLINALIRGLNRLPTAPVSATIVQRNDAPWHLVSTAATRIYMNRTVSTYLDIQALNKSNALYKIDDVFGMPRRSFRGIPVRIVDQILNTETQLT